MQKVTEDTLLIKSSRTITIKAQHIDDLNMFQCYIVDKQNEAKTSNLYNLERSLPSKNDLNNNE
jgi:hypothetical protein